MQELIQNIIEQLQELVASNNILIGLFFGFFVIILESIIPILPLALFIAVNMLVFGNIVGFLMSWIATILGCSLSFFIFKIGRASCRERV